MRIFIAGATGARGIEGVVLRYGNFYGPGSALSRSGAMGEMVRRAKFPVVGGGTGVWSWIHIDDDPAPIAEWLPYLAEQLGGKRPMRFPPGWPGR